VRRVFVTGATRFISSAIVQERMHTGHKVLGLARNAAAALAQLGVEAHRGELSEMESLAADTWACDGDL